MRRAFLYLFPLFPPLLFLSFFFSFSINSEALFRFPPHHYLPSSFHLFLKPSILSRVPSHPFYFVLCYPSTTCATSPISRASPPISLVFSSLPLPSLFPFPWSLYIISVFVIISLFRLECNPHFCLSFVSFNCLCGRVTMLFIATPILCNTFVDHCLSTCYQLAKNESIITNNQSGINKIRT